MLHMLRNVLKRGDSVSPAPQEQTAFCLVELSADSRCSIVFYVKICHARPFSGIVMLRCMLERFTHFLLCDYFIYVTCALSCLGC